MVQRNSSAAIRRNFIQPTRLVRSFLEAAKGFSPRLLSREIGLALEKARKRAKRGDKVESVAAAYLEVAVPSPALYEVMFSLSH